MGVISARVWYTAVMDKIKQKRSEVIRSVVWDLTIGCGNDSEEITQDDWTDIHKSVDGEFSVDDTAWAKKCWREWLQCMAQP